MTIRLARDWRDDARDFIRSLAAKFARGVAQGAGLVIGFVGVLAAIKTIGEWLA